MTGAVVAVAHCVACIQSRRRRCRLNYGRAATPLRLLRLLELLRLLVQLKVLLKLVQLKLMLLKLLLL